MVTIYTSQNCLSSKKAKIWLEEHNIPYKERKVQIDRLTIREIKKIVSRTEEGLEEIISTRSKLFKKLNFDLETASIQKLFQVISENPNFLRCPIIIDEKRFLAGYNEIEIRRFLPRKERKFILQHLQQAHLSLN